jgi:hypothetical protein
VNLRDYRGTPQKPDERCETHGCFIVDDVCPKCRRIIVDEDPIPQEAFDEMKRLGQKANAG